MIGSCDPSNHLFIFFEESELETMFDEEQDPITKNGFILYEGMWLPLQGTVAQNLEEVAGKYAYEKFRLEHQETIVSTNITVSGRGYDELTQTGKVGSHEGHAHLCFLDAGRLELLNDHEKHTYHHLHDLSDI